MPTKIQRAFSASAKNYDEFTGLHRQIADELLSRITDEVPCNILDVGCGTGYVTLKLKEQHPQSCVVGLDFSAEMLEIARSKDENIDWVLADSHQIPFADESFEMVVSNLSYQWAGDLARAFVEARRVLGTGGIFSCTLFGFHTCQELFQSLDEENITFSRLPDLSQVKQALEAAGFRDLHVESQEIKIEFKGMYELISWLKSIGANHLPREGFLGPGALSRAADNYRRRFSYLEGVAASFEVIKVYAKK